MSLPRIAITMGDPAGIGPELCLRLLADERVRAFCVPIVFGDMGTLMTVAHSLGWPQPHPDDVVHIVSSATISSFLPGIVSPECGAAAYKYFITAIDEAL